MSKAKDVSNWRRRKKQELVEMFGDECHDCGKSYPPYVYHFDHRDPNMKEFGIAAKGTTKGWDRMVAEAEKCDMVCANCHAERTHRQRCAGCEFCHSDVM